MVLTLVQQEHPSGLQAEGSVVGWGPRGGIAAPRCYLLCNSDVDDGLAPPGKPLAVRGHDHAARDVRAQALLLVINHKAAKGPTYRPPTW